ncbi:MAG: hypothetical protein LQ340_008128, partial [Diploschistes diacapsis]
MLHSLTYTTLLDDVLHADPTTNALETQLASLLGHVSATLVSSGTMGNQLAARVHLSQHPSAGPPHSILADPRSHIMHYEAGSICSLSGAFPIAVSPAPGSGRDYLTLADILPHVALGSDDEHVAPTRLICLENTIHGAILPLEACREITGWARAHGIRTHLDGARLWEAVAALVARGETFGVGDGGGADGPASLRAKLEAGLGAYGALFDSVTVCFSKGLGAPLGSMLAGSHPFVKHARHVRKSWGGGMRQTGLLSAPAAVAVRDTFFGAQLSRSHQVAARVGRMWAERGGRL